jgi:hypothetical protein
MSHLPGNKRMAVALTVTRGKRAPYIVEPLTESPIEKLTAEWHTADPERKAAIEAEVASLRGQA